MTTLDKGALDKWITTEPNWHEVIIVTETNFAEVMGDDDIRLNELKCHWSGERIGYSDWEHGDDYDVYFTSFYVLDEDREVLVKAELYEDRQADDNARERELDRQYAEYQVTHNNR